ncbi:hypothetical protein [Rhizobium sp. BK376]|uniref:hypothetical protein n=1 Tax=Rhizobium sp. BK376 TaxID=2512149 RepID=UPI001049FE31|nr:hypothetical protein [Rhizobium sp. BK376]TCR92571.1 hypothetical protein EV561_1014 [Rhizobium sp. BK376]
MFNFGKLTARKETVEMPDGSPVDILVMYDANGVEWHDAYKAQPVFDYYLAILDNGRVVSMEADPEHSQIADLTILGLSTAETGGYTRGPGGSVYGKWWNGSTLTDPVLSREEYPVLLPTVFWKAAREIGVYKADIVTQLNQIPDPDQREDALIDLDECSGFIRLNPLVVSLSDTYQITPEQLDTLWLWAANTQV